MGKICLMFWSLRLRLCCFFCYWYCCCCFFCCWYCCCCFISCSLFDSRMESKMFGACKEGRIEEVREILKIHSYANIQDAYERTPLFIATQNEHVHVVKLLLQSNANVNAEEKYGRTALHTAALQGRVHLAKVLLESKANVNARDQDGVTPLYTAAYNGNVDLITLLLKSKARVNIQEKYGRTPLFITSQKGYVDVAKLLLESKAIVNIGEKDGKTPLLVASQNGDMAVVKLLLKFNANVNTPQNDGATPLYIASKEGHIDLVKFLLESNANVNVQERYGQTPLFIASKLNRIEMAKLLLESKANVDIQDGDGQSPLHIACSRGYIDMMKLLLASNANVNVKDKTGRTPLHTASSKGDINLARLLLEANANVNAQDEVGQTPISIASHNDNVDYAKFLLKLNAVVAHDESTENLLNLAYELADVEFIQLLVSAGANPDYKNENEDTCLHFACRQSNREVVELLLRAGGDPNSKNKKGNTPQHIICENDSLEILLLLLQYRCIPSQNSEGKYPFDFSIWASNRAAHKALFEVFGRNFYFFEKGTEDKFVECIIDQQMKEAMQMMKSANENSLLLGACHCLLRNDLSFFKEIPIHDYNKKVKKRTLLEVALELKNKEAFEFLLRKCGGGQKFSDCLSTACVGLRDDHLRWLLDSFPHRLKKLPLCELFYLSQGSCTDLLLDFLLPECSPELQEIFGSISFSCPEVKIPPSPLITNEIVDLFPWRRMAATLTHLELSNCALTQLPRGICFLDERKVIRINLEGNRLSDVENAVLEGGNPKDIIFMVRELKGGGVELKEKKVLVVGDAAVGKTTLLRGLGGENEVAAKVATDGIEIGELHLGGVVLNCWDFAGQEVYRYTHQLFLSDSSIYLLLFNLSQPIPSICSQLTYWLDSISHRAPASQILLVGTHASVVPPENKHQVVEAVAQKFSEHVGGEVLVVDSLTGEGLGSVKESLLGVALHNLPRVPRLFEEIRQSFKQYRDFEKDSHLVEVNQLKVILEKTQMLGSLTEESWEWCLRVLHCLGSIVLVDWDIYMGNQYTRSTYAILRPSWLVDVFKTVVTMRHNYVKDGVVSIERLRRCWEGYDESIHDLLLEALVKFGVVCRMSGRGEGKVIVPCLLPDCAPDNFFVWTQNGEEALSCLGGHSESEVTRHSQTFRRSFLLKREKSRLPVGVMGKVLSTMFQWGKVQYAWKTGCIVVCGDEDKVVAMMWEGMCRTRSGVHFAFSAENSTPSLSFDSSLDRSSSTVREILQQASQLMQNLFDDFYKVDYEAVVPCSLDQQGIPLTWAKVSEILVAMYESNSTVSVVTREGTFGGEVALGGLVPDLMLDQASVRFLDKDSIVMGHLLGSGAFGEVWEGEIPWEIDPEQGRRDQREEEKETQILETKKVAVKKILLDEQLKEDSFEEILKMLHHETYFSLQMQHPNVVKMVGMCSQTSPPLLLLELLDGDLYSSLIDPLDLKPILKEFEKAVGLVVLEEKSWDEVISSPSASSLKFCHLLEELRGILKKSPAQVQQKGEEFLSKTTNYLNTPTPTVCDIYQESLDNLLETYAGALNEMAPLSMTGVLRIAADISQGLHYLHSQVPSLLHRDIKGRNIFLTKSLLNGGGTEKYASQNIVAKLGDFGLSAVLCGPYQLRAQGNMVKINQRWAAPEILEGRDYSVESDVYSMALAFWEARYRKLAYYDLDGFEDKIKVEISEGTRPELSFFDEFDEIIQRCWCSSPSDRFTAHQTYSSIRSLSSTLAPSLYQHLPPISNSPTCEKLENFSHNGKFVKTVELPKNIYNEKRDRVTCLTTFAGELWGGCDSGVFCYYEEEEEELSPGEEKGEFMRCHNSQLLGDGGETGVSAMVADKQGLVWVGNENGWLSVWKNGYGPVVGEEVKFSVPLLNKSSKIFSKDSSFLKLEFGVVSWRWSSFMKRGEEKEGRVLLREVGEVREVRGKRGGVGLVLVEKGGKEREFELGREEGQKALNHLNFALFCGGQNRVLKRVGEQMLNINKKVTALEIAGGRAWSFDESLKIREWKAAPDLTGKQKGIYQLSSLRTLDFHSLPLSFDLSQNPFSCFFPAGNEELYVIFREFGVVLERFSTIENDKEEGGLEMKSEWDIFGEEDKIGERKGGEGWISGKKKVWRVGVGGGLRRETMCEGVETSKREEMIEEERGGGWDLFEDEETPNEPMTGREEGKRGQAFPIEEQERGEVWCGVYFGLRKEVWVGTAEGWVWRKGEKLEKRKVGGGVSAMAVVGNQVWCGTIQGKIYQFDALNFTLINNKNEEENQNENQITSFGVIPGRAVWSGSLKGTISLWR